MMWYVFVFSAVQRSLCVAIAILFLGVRCEAENLAVSVLSKSESEETLNRLWAERKKRIEEETKMELAEEQIRAEGKVLRWAERIFGDAPPSGRSLWISLHGGGNCPPEVNDQQWQNQIRLYMPSEGIVVAPRAPTNDWDLWHQPHIDALLDRLIAAMICVRGVDPNRVYLLGYSAGGDGVYQLAPRMADRWAAAAMMAGHPNDARPEGLRNLPFLIFCGAEDSAYDRNKIAAEWGKKLEALAAVDSGGYVHTATIYPKTGHWMKRRDAAALPVMAAVARNPWPKKVVWVQDDVLHDRFYWLQRPAGAAKKGEMLRAEAEGQRIKLESSEVREVVLRLSDELVDLDRPIEVIAGGKTIFNGPVLRSADVLRRSLEERVDPASAACAELKVVW
jgi:hypothetical protein